jgi:carbon monoxide dehydrogenase subunit G
MAVELIREGRRQHQGQERPALRDPIVLRLRAVAQVRRDPDWVFSELHDPETLLSCIPNGRLTRRDGPRSFEAQVPFGIGPFRFAYSGTGRIVDSDPQRRTASMTLSGRPASNVPRIRVRMAMAVTGHAEGSEIQMAFRVVISDRTGLLSQGWVNPIACDLLDRTIHRIKQRLEGPDGAPGPTAA